MVVVIPIREKGEIMTKNYTEDVILDMLEEEREKNLAADMDEKEANGLFNIAYNYYSTWMNLF